MSLVIQQMQTHTSVFIKMWKVEKVISSKNSRALESWKKS